MNSYACSHTCGRPTLHDGICMPKSKAEQLGLPVANYPTFSVVSWVLLHWYLESQIELALGEDVIWRFRYRRSRTVDGGWWDLQRGHIPWRPNPEE